MPPSCAAARGQGLGIGTRSAYENLLTIEAAWRLLEAAPAMWLIPGDNRRLVEAGVGKTALEALALSLGGAWVDHFNTVMARHSAQAGAALLVQVRWDHPWDDQGGWSDLGEEARTRLGLDGVDLEWSEPWRTPFGNTICRMTVPVWMLRGNLGPVTTESLGDELRITVADTVLRYGRLGLRAQ